MGASDEEPKFPDLTPIGLAFAQAITYINYRRYPDLDSDARAWLIKAATTLMNQLKQELEGLHNNKDDRTKLPQWALDPKASLFLICSIPHVLMPYNTQITDSLQKLFDACGLSCAIRMTEQGAIFLNFTFAEAGLKRKDNNEIVKGSVFDEDFQKKLFDAVKNMKIGD